MALRGCLRGNTRLLGMAMDLFRGTWVIVSVRRCTIIWSRCLCIIVSGIRNRCACFGSARGIFWQTSTLAVGLKCNCK